MPMNFGTLFRDKDFEKTNSKIDKLSNELAIKPRFSHAHNDDEVSSILNTYLNTDDPNSSVSKILENFAVPTARTNRYAGYDEIYSSVQLIKAIIKVYIDNTLQKDVLSKNVINYKITNDFDKSNSDNTQLYKKYTQNCFKHFNIEKQLRFKTLHNLLRYGDSFIELVDLKTDIGTLPNPNRNKNSSVETLSPIQENNYNSNYLSNNNNYYSNENNIINNFVNTVFEFDNYKENNYNDILLEEQVIGYDEKDKIKKHNLVDKTIFSRVLVRYHSPKDIVILNTKYGDVLGYVELRQNINFEVMQNPALQFASMIRQINVLGKDKKESNDTAIKKIVKVVINKAIEKTGIQKNYNGKKSSKDVNKQYEEELRLSLGDQIFYLIKQMYEENLKDETILKKISIRFIPKDRMIHFCLNPVEYYPYGTSLLDPLIYPAKLYLLNQITNMVIKLSRASVIRKWTIETGAREDHGNMIQKLRSQLRNQKLTGTDILGAKSIPQILSDFKDMVTLQKKGVKFLDVDIQSLGDPNIKVQDLEDARREIISLSGVPAPYLGYNDVIDLREELVNINITFATNIISIQEVLNEGLTEISNKIYKIISDGDTTELPTNYIKPSLNPPVILLLQMLESTITSVGNVQMFFQNTNIDFNPYYFLQQFIPGLDWDEFKQSAKEYILLKKAEQAPMDVNDPASSGVDGGGY